MKPRSRVILENAIEEGVRRGYNRAHKHTLEPHEDMILQEIVDAVMSSITEYFVFEDTDF